MIICLPRQVAVLGSFLLLAAAGCEGGTERGRDVGPPGEDAEPAEQGVPDAGDDELGPDGCRPVAESCNGLDDDCDGLTDEDFLLARDVQHCGSCGHRCRYVNGAAACVDGQCRLARCVPGYVDRDGREDNGCEERCALSNGGIEICDGQDNDCNGVVDDGYDLQTDPSHCGACGRVCNLWHAVPGCAGGECIVDHCEAGWFDDDGLALTGCEATCLRSNGGVEACDHQDNDCDGFTDEDFDLQSSLVDCGACGHVCSFPNAVPRCLAGECVISRCEEGWSDRGGLEDGCETPCVVTNGGVELCDGVDNDCNGVVDDGFDLQTDPDNCAQCGRECRVANGEASCVAGECLLAACEPGFLDADGRYDNGCEVPCLPDEDPFELCDGRDNDCDGQTDEIWDLTSDPFNCGSCGRICAFANAVAGCSSGACTIASCEPGYADFDRRLDNGCEAICTPTNDGVETCDGLDNDCDGVVDDGYDLLSDPDHCGACDRVCPQVASGVRGCLAGECAIAQCLAGWHDADRDFANGCEYRCDPSANPAEVCDEQDNDCDGSTDEGFDKLHGLDHCGGCFQECRPPQAVPVCDAGSCRIAVCELGWHDANHEVADGCELDCDITNGGLEICDELDNDCNGIVDDGFDKQHDPAHCGDCATSCLQPHRQASCDDGRCVLGGCVEGWADANGLADDGCEYACTFTGNEVCDGQDNDCDGLVDEDFDLQVDLANCGQCGRFCGYDHAQGLCDRGVCRRGDCHPGWWDVNRNPLDGCEYGCLPSNAGVEICDGKDNDCNGTVDDGYDLLNDPRNCGACGRACNLLGAVSFCNEGNCAVLTCEEGWQDVNGLPEDGCECRLSNGGVEICDGLDNDCNGIRDDNLGSPPISCLGFGVCAGVEPRCDGEAGWVCPYPETYMAEETRCDDLDNDCDGTVDEGEAFVHKGEACAFGLGVCRGEGRMVCNEAGDGVVCSEREHPERQGQEICDGLDNDCDGEVDEGSDEMVQIGDLLIYRYEAARPDATAESAGSSFARACSTAGHLPWTNVDWETARTACSRAEGAHLCTEEEWRLACAGALEGGWLYPYHATDYGPETCNGFDRHAGRPLPAGSLPGCTTPAGVLDLSGNVWEWIDTDRSPGGDGSIRAFIGGSYGNVSLGLTCDFDVAAAPGTARDNIGFRCCKSSN